MHPSKNCEMFDSDHTFILYGVYESNNAKCLLRIVFLSLFMLEPNTLDSLLSAVVAFLYSFLRSHSHTVNLLSALPLQCLDVLLIIPLQPNSEQCQGVNMDCVHTLMMFMERRLEMVKAEGGLGILVPPFQIYSWIWECLEVKLELRFKHF